MDMSIIIPLLAGLVIIIAWYASAHGRRRQDAFRRTARQRGLSYTKRADIHDIGEFRDLHIFAKGSRTTVKNLIRVNKGRVHIQLFDYQYREGTGHSSRATRQTVFAASSDRLNMPACMLYPRSLFSLIGSILGKKEIDVSSNKAFSKTYVVQGVDEGAIRALFTDVVIRYFEKKPGLTLEGNGNRLICYRSGRLEGPDEISSFFDNGQEILRFFESNH
jgi:hypothetical protein